MEVSGHADPLSRALGQTDYGHTMKAVGHIYDLIYIGLDLYIGLVLCIVFDLYIGLDLDIWLELCIRLDLYT